MLRISHLNLQMNGMSLKMFFLRTSLLLPVDFTIPSFVHHRASYKSLLKLIEHDHSLLWGVGHHGVNTKTGIKNRSRASSCVFPVAGSLFICFAPPPEPTAPFLKKVMCRTLSGTCSTSVTAVCQSQSWDGEMRSERPGVWPESK